MPATNDVIDVATTLRLYIAAMVTFGLLVFCVAPSILAAKKGYSWYLWTFGGGLIGLVVLAVLPSLTRAPLPSDEIRERRKTGDKIGAALSVFTIGGWLFIALGKWIGS